MAPLLPNTDSSEHFPDLYVSSLNTRSTIAAAHDIVKRSAHVFKRAVDPSFIPGQGSKNPSTFNNQAFLALFATLGGLMVLASLWFFFWAKNGGFQWQEGDWDDYKSTVLRRKGPDGKTLSNATKSTKLGGMSIAGTQHYKWARHAARSVVSYDEKGRKGILGKRGWGKTHSVTYSDDFTSSAGTETVSDMSEIRGEPHYKIQHSKRYRDEDMREYKKERPARVGGLNRVADGSGIGTSTNGSDLYSHPPEHSIPSKNKDKDRAERRAREEAAKMERRWKREAEEAAAALAHESARSIPQPKKAAAPSPKSTPSPTKQRQASRSNSPKKRDFSYSAGAAGAASEVLSTAYTGSSGQRTASYYEAYRPRAASNPRYSTDQGTANRTRQSSPQKKTATRASTGYRRGADSDLD
jgi:hypothetical protein